MKNLIQKENFILDISGDSYMLQEKGVSVLFDQSILNYQSSNFTIEIFLREIVKNHFFPLRGVITETLKKRNLPYENLCLRSISTLSLDDLFFIASHVEDLFIGLIGVKVDSKNEIVSVSQPQCFKDSKFDFIGVIYSFEKIPAIAFSKMYKTEKQLQNYYNNGNFDLVLRDANGYSISDKLFSKSIVPLLTVEDDLFEDSRRFA